MIRIPPEDLKFIRVLGKGGCGEVHLAESKTLGEVAVKKTILGGEEQVMQEFLNEAELLSQMNSPYIIRFFGTSRNKEGECIVMEYATNGTLFHFLELLRRRKIESTFSWDKRYQMAQDITRGLLLMHSQGVLHRDMKSLNILLDKYMRAKISDFGFSKIKTKTRNISSNLYVQNNVFGSLLWKAPETFSIKNPYSDKADIYALGIVFWEIASCQVPYEGFDFDTIKDSVKIGERLDIPSACPVEFKVLIEHCWHQDPKQRPAASNVFDKITQLIGQIPKLDSENLTYSIPHLSGSNPDSVITFQPVPKNNLIITGVNPNRLVTDNQSLKNNGESEIEGKNRLAHEKKQLIEKEKRVVEEERQQGDEKKKQEEEQKRKQDAIKKENQRIEKVMKDEQERKEKTEEERIIKEKKLQEEQDRKNNEKQESNKKEEDERKIKEEYESIEKWKTTKAPDFEGNIFEVAAKGKLKSIIYLLANGTKVNEWFSNDNYDGWVGMQNSTPLHFSSRYGHLHVVEYLVNQKAVINSKDNEYRTPLHCAAINGHHRVVEYLVNQKADINAKDKFNRTPLHYSASNGHLSIVEYLVNQEAVINEIDILVEFFYLIGLIFIMLLLMVILVLLNV